MEYLEEYCIGVLSVWDEHVHCFSCKGLEMLQGVLETLERFSSIVCEPVEDIRQYLVGRTLL